MSFHYGGGKIRARSSVLLYANPDRNTNEEKQEIELFHLLIQMFEELKKQPTINNHEAGSFKAQCRRDYLEMEYTRPELERDLAECQIAHDEFKSLGQKSLMKKVELRIEACKSILEENTNVK